MSHSETKRMYVRTYGGLTVGGTPEAVERRSHNTPLRNSNHVNGLRTLQLRGTVAITPASKGGVLCRMCHCRRREGGII